MAGSKTKRKRIELSSLHKELQSLADDTKRSILQGFFKTGKGEYAEGDIFLGVTVPQQRAIAKKYASLQLADIITLLQSPIHEHRLTALLILIHQYETGTSTKQYTIVRSYLAYTQYVNNWDLVDLSAPKLLGAYLLDKPRDRLYRLAVSSLLWERRIAMVACHTFIKNNDFADTLRIAQLLLYDREDLMHKATGWMLREIGKRDRHVLERFLTLHHKAMPRTMLRYALEHFSKKERKKYMVGL